MATPLSPAIEQVHVRFLANQFSRFLGIELISVSETEVVIGLPIKDEHKQNAGFVHGGVLATLADVAMGFAAVAAAPVTHHVLTGDLRIAYLNPGIGTYLFARGYAIKAGRKIVFTEAEIYRTAGDEKIPVCKASATMVLVAPEGLVPPS
jgi:uncharacterized protein (TIGR00369 family)